MWTKTDLSTSMFYVLTVTVWPKQWCIVRQKRKLKTQFERLAMYSSKTKVTFFSKAQCSKCSCKTFSRNHHSCIRQCFAQETKLDLACAVERQSIIVTPDVLSDDRPKPSTTYSRLLVVFYGSAMCLKICTPFHLLSLVRTVYTTDFFMVAIKSLV